MISTMNWRRGFIRLWLVLSVVWIGVAAYTFSLPSSLRLTFVPIPPAERVDSPASGGYGKDSTEPPKLRDPTAPDTGGFARIGPSVPTFEALRQELVRRQEAARNHLRDFALLGTGIPAAAFMFGVGGWWVCRGFKSAPTGARRDQL
jgi:hypothetical protein